MEHEDDFLQLFCILVPKFIIIIIINIFNVV